MYPLASKIISIDMGCHSYKIIEAVIEPRFRILKFGLCPEYKLSTSVSPRREWRKLGYHTKEAILSFHHKSLIIRDLILPVSQGYNLHKSIYEEIKKYQDDFNDEYDYDYTINLPKDESEFYLAQTVAVSRSVNRNYIDKAIVYGLKPRIIDAQVNASQRFICRIMNQCEVLPSVCFILDLGHEYTTAGIISTDSIIQKVIPFGCRQMEGQTSIPEEAMQIITISHQLIDYYYYFNKHRIQYGIMYGGGVYIKGLTDYIINYIPLNWHDLNYYKEHLPEVPCNMDLNLFVNSLGSLLRCRTLEFGRGKAYDEC